MARFLVVYHGSEMPHDPEIMAQAKAAFEQWVGEVGDAIVDPGAPLRMVAQVSRDNVDDPVDVSGYSIIEAASAEAAVALLRSHPFVARGGILQVNEPVGV
jgi:hypothetical protein